MMNTANTVFNLHSSFPGCRRGDLNPHARWATAPKVACAVAAKSAGFVQQIRLIWPQAKTDLLPIIIRRCVVAANRAWPSTVFELQGDKPICILSQIRIPNLKQKGGVVREENR